jgi:hypothetical protein
LLVEDVEKSRQDERYDEEAEKSKIFIFESPEATNEPGRRGPGRDAYLTFSRVARLALKKPVVVSRFSVVSHLGLDILILLDRGMYTLSAQGILIPSSVDHERGAAVCWTSQEEPAS